MHQFPICTPEDMGLEITSEVAPQELVDSLNSYFKQFIKPVICTQDGHDLRGVLCVCGRKLTGPIGTFRYDPENKGSGNCAACGWPARANHDVLDDEGLVIITIENEPLPLHPDYVAKRGMNASHVIRVHA